jgi:hypothetical protein
MVISAQHLPQYITDSTILPLRDPDGKLVTHLTGAEIRALAADGKLSGRGSRNTLRYVESVGELGALFDPESPGRVRSQASQTAYEQRLSRGLVWQHSQRCWAWNHSG